jgi:hypothetical protein
MTTGSRASLTIRFEDEEGVASWFGKLRTGGALPAGAGVRRADALDFAGKRNERNAYIVSSDPGAGEWLVAPCWTDAEGKAGCPECGGFGYHEDGSEEGRDCSTCEGNGVATKDAGDAYLEGRH